MMNMTLAAYLFALALCFSAADYVHAETSEVLNPPIQTTTKKKAKKAKPDGGSQATFIDKTGETRKARDSRLYRECKGGVNAGACAGYTR